MDNRNAKGFQQDTFTPPVPAGNSSNAVVYDRAGWPRIGSGPPGAYSTPRFQVVLPLIRR